MNRNEILSVIKNNPEVSVLIVGAGINGIGTFRDLASNGVDVLLVDRADFCSGASSASSHMAHGGIRYLENGEFRLVREAVDEIADALGESLNWEGKRKKDEAARALNLLEERHGVRL
jgi:glycerol-3-phosphate dehydrogenase